MKAKRDIQFLFEVSAFRNVARVWNHFLAPDVANNAEHTFRVVWIALAIAKHEKASDVEKIMKMALIHDLPESRCGDVNYISRQYVKRNESMAVEDILEDTILREEFLEIFHEYEKRESLEAKIVKDADNLDVDLEIREMISKGYQIGYIKQKGRQKSKSPKLYTKTAVKLLTDIRKSNPHDWHTLSKRNRYKAGDWKK